MVRWNPVAVEEAGKSPICPIVALEATADSLSNIVEGGDGDTGTVNVGDTLFDWQ